MPAPPSPAPRADLDKLVQQAAEHVYEVTQPYRYANYLDRNYDPNGLADRVARATAIYRRLIAGDDPVERAWAWNGLGTIEFNFHGDQRLSSDYYRKSIASTPDFTIAYFALASRDQVLNQRRRTAGQFSRGRPAAEPRCRARPQPALHHLCARQRQEQYRISTGDFAAAIPIYQAGAELPDDFSVLARGNFTQGALQSMVRQHDLGAMHAYARCIGHRTISGLRTPFSGCRD